MITVKCVCGNKDIKVKEYKDLDVLEIEPCYFCLENKRRLKEEEKLNISQIAYRDGNKAGHNEALVSIATVALNKMDHS